ncbi:SSU ribosomal protein S6P [Sulfobacillus acidophilus DSM 10332]|uniref:Small ribosomal subunit protein bS6 n=1 Tax=Sulfobacillus acidophilus (strain ATCC 700253 / DSM 10332 / NAL) TaxID=679936 RepID=G8TUY1_SULAD|nr:SSU ribosomal protein S6P [Sulfobacillus acidophilus DSM 10332]
MAQYELMYILKPDLGDEALQEDIEKFSQMIQTAGGAVEKTDKWGRRKLAYEIQGYTEGFYVVVNFTGSGDIANEITRILRINDDVIRSIVVRLDD